MPRWWLWLPTDVVVISILELASDSLIYIYWFLIESFNIIYWLAVEQWIVVNYISLVLSCNGVSVDQYMNPLRSEICRHWRHHHVFLTTKLAPWQITVFQCTLKGMCYWYCFSRKIGNFLSYIANVMATDDLVVQGPKHQQPRYWPSMPGITQAHMTSVNLLGPGQCI